MVIKQIRKLSFFFFFFSFFFSDNDSRASFHLTNDTKNNSILRLVHKSGREGLCVHKKNKSNIYTFFGTQDSEVLVKSPRHH